MREPKDIEHPNFKEAFGSMTNHSESIKKLRTDLDNEKLKNVDLLAALRFLKICFSSNGLDAAMPRAFEIINETLSRSDKESTQ